MNREQLKAAAERGIPFKILMADGKYYWVPSPEHIGFPPNHQYIMVFSDSGGQTILDLKKIIDLEFFIPEPKQPL